MPSLVGSSIHPIEIQNAPLLKRCLAPFGLAAEFSDQNCLNDISATPPLKFSIKYYLYTFLLIPLA